MIIQKVTGQILAEKKSCQICQKKDLECKFNLYEHTTICTQAYYVYLNAHLAKANKLNDTWSQRDKKVFEIHRCLWYFPLADLATLPHQHIWYVNSRRKYIAFTATTQREHRHEDQY